MNVARVAACAGAALLSMAMLRAGERAADDALFRAIQRSDLEAVRKSIASGADVNAKDRSGTPALMQAAVYSNSECIRLLLAKGADVNIANSAGATALIWSAGDPEKVRLLISSGANINAAANSGRTPLMAAASAGNVAGVKLLLAKGANVKAIHPGRGGAVLAAANTGDEAMLRILLEAGGDPNERDRLGQTPLMMACQFGRIEPARVLLDAGAKVNDQSGRRPLVKIGLQELGELTPLLIAAPTGNSELVKLLLERGADVNARDMRGMTPLMMAASSEAQDVETVRLLIARGADAGIKAGDGQTPASWAGKWGSAGVLKLLNAASASPVQLSAVKAAGPPRRTKLQPAVEQAIALLQSSSATYFKNSGCVGCHHQPLTGMAVAMVRERGWKVDEQLAKEQLRASVAVRMPEREGLLQGVSRGGAPMTDSLLLLSLDVQGYSADALTTALAHSIAGMQSNDGAWRPHIVRPPIEYSPFSETAYAVRALQVYAPEGRKAEFARRIARARDWLYSQRPVHNEEAVKHLLALAWAGAKPEVIRAAATRLVSEQRPDGGWAQRQGFPSDAYATGQTLFALNKAAGIRPVEPPYQRGASFLRNTQLEDGSWHVTSRSVKFQPYFDGGFPHEHDQWISAAGSAWAAMALALAVEDQIPGQ